MRRDQYETVIRQLGTPVVFHQAKLPNATVATIAGVNTSSKDEVITNAYGVGSKIVTLMESVMGGLVPEKYDYVVMGAEKIVFEAVFPTHEPKTGAVIGFRCVAKGK